MAHTQSGRRARPWPSWRLWAPPLILYPSCVNAAKIHQALATSSLNRPPRTEIISEIRLAIRYRRL